MDTCFLFTEHLNEEGCLSLKLNQKGQIEAPLNQRSFSTIQTFQTNSNTYLVVSGQRFSLHRLELPWLAEQKARAAIPFALEDKLAQNFDTLHFAFDKAHYRNGHYLVTLADKAYLRHLITTFDEQHINFNLLTLDWFALMANETAILEHCLLVNNDNVQGTLSSDLLPFYLQKYSEDQTLYYFTDSNKELLGLSPSRPRTEVKESSYVWLAQRLQKMQPLNLCQGELQHGSSQTKTKHLYQATIAMCLVWLVTIIAVNSVKLYFLNNDIVEVDSKIAVLYREFFPQAQQVISPKFRISQLLKTNQSSTDSSFWILLNLLAKIYQKNSVIIEQLRFQNETIVLTLATKNFENLEDLQIKLQKNNVKVKQTQASTREGQVVGTLELTL